MDSSELPAAGHRHHSSGMDCGLSLKTSRLLLVFKNLAIENTPLFVMQLLPMSKTLSVLLHDNAS